MLIAFKIVSVILFSFIIFNFGLESLKLKQEDINFLWGIIFKINEFLILDWRSITKSNNSIFCFLSSFLTINACHHLKPKYLIFKFYVSISQFRSFNVELKWFSWAER